ncbi:ABC transporter permease [Rhodococcus tukisamuensis]|uniref:NitT/TauT family transport system permease protein n=1 Tax=Rhodococcus tukisamuensis TaxID=168276 RepID=A0A1G6T5L1_9NOCA|nr:ABC transporter permease [Rhodococcus tukisamuensis]SDD24358.1 NitT/TauT family transport system permease protein [Rhodococcus tukisamuensis]
MSITDQLSSTSPVAEAPRDKPSRWWQLGGETLTVRGWQIIILVAWLGLWQLTTMNKWIDPVLAKTPAQSWNYFVSALESGELVDNTGYTMMAVAIAWILAGTAGVIAGLALGLLPKVERVTTPFLDAANAMPRIALAPLFIVAFGINTTAKVALAATLVFFIVMSSARAGVQSTDSEWLRLSAVLGAKKPQLFFKVLFPVATPAIFAGMRLGLIYSLLGVVGSELISAKNGLGQLVATYSATYRMEAVYAILLFLAIIAVVLNQAMGIAERRFLRWQPPADH